MNIIGEKPADSKGAEMDKAVKETLEALVETIRSPALNRELPADDE